MDKCSTCKNRLLYNCTGCNGQINYEPMQERRDKDAKQI
jgi:hypothetical protein